MRKPGRKRASLPFWERKALKDMNPQEWESLCDGCGLCCCYRSVKDEDAGKQACPLLNTESARCNNYARRKEFVPDCFKITPKNIESATWLPPTCAYLRLAQGKRLPKWHHLISGSRETVHLEGKSVRGKIFSMNSSSDDL